MRHPTLLSVFTVGLVLINSVEGASTGGTPAGVRRLDETLERPDAWRLEDKDAACRAVGRVRIGLDSEETHGTPRALVMDWNQDLGDLGGKGIHATPIAPCVAIQLPEDLDLSRYTRLTFWARIDGARAGGLYLGLCDKPALWGRGLKRNLAHAPLNAGPWRRVLFPIADAEPEVVKAVRWLIIGCANMGHMPDEKKVLRLWLDDFQLTATPLRKTQGWDADPTVVVTSQLGFRRFHRKVAVVRGENKARTFVVRDAESGREAYKGGLRLVRSAAGVYRMADFTRLTAPGRYVVAVGDLKSLPFPIGDDVYRPCVELISDWVFNMRCGCKTNIHPPCHTDDGVLVDYEGEGKARREVSRRRLDVVGGWHDAGDARTYYWYSVAMGHLCLRARECGWRRDRDGDGVDDLMDSAVWAVGHIPKVRDPKTGQFLFKISDWPDYRRGNYWTDNKPGTHDDRHIMRLRSPKAEIDTAARAAASAGLFARVCSKAHRGLADAALAAVEPRWAYWFDPDTGQKKWREKFPHVYKHGNHVALWGQGSLQLHLATGKPVYLAFARRCAEVICEYQKRTFYPGGAQPLCGEICSWHRNMPGRDLPEEFLADLMLERPDSPDYFTWRAALVRAAEWWMKPTRRYWRPFSVPHLETPAREIKDGFVGVPLEVSAQTGVVRWLVPTANKQLGDTACSLSRVARALGDVELEQAIRLQTQWAVGLNPFNVSWVCGFGADCIEQFFSVTQGRMPGSVSMHGIGQDGVPRCRRPRGGEVWTRMGARLMRALIAVSEPARVRLTVLKAGKPWTRPVLVRWSVSRETVFQGVPDPTGRLPELKLDGGQRYELLTGGVRMPLAVTSGTAYERTVDLDRIVVLSASKPKYVMPGQSFAVDLTVHNRGLADATVAIAVHAADARAETSAQTVKVGARKAAALSWRFKAGAGGRPYVLTFAPDGDRTALLDVTGPILP